MIEKQMKLLAHPVLGSYLFMPSTGSFMRTGNNEMTNQRTFIDVCYELLLLFNFVIKNL